MTEREWLGCDDPRRLLDALGRASDRKLRLFACACCRHVWDRLTGPSRRLAEAAERYAEGEAPYEELEAAQAAWADVARHTREARASMDAARVCSYAVADDAWLAAVHACEAVDVADETCPRCALLRDVFGNPFRPAAVEPAWLAWNGGR